MFVEGQADPAPCMVPDPLSPGDILNKKAYPSCPKLWICLFPLLFCLAFLEHLAQLHNFQRCQTRLLALVPTQPPSQCSPLCPAPHTPVGWQLSTLKS